MPTLRVRGALHGGIGGLRQETGEVPRMPGGAPGALQRHPGVPRQRDATEVPGRAYRNHGGGTGPPYRTIHGAVRRMQREGVPDGVRAL